ncbi:MAG: UvrD-helicase domain-containing protein [bacterium]
MSDQRRLIDAADRERATSELETSFAVEAAAGAGKTTVLVERLLALVGRGRATLDEIVAITFTEKAAGELKVRLREELEKAIAASPSAEVAARYARALDDLGHAPIGTIHSFCASLLRERPVEAGVDPQFQVADELACSLLRERVWEAWLEEELAAGDPALLRAVAHGIRLEDPDGGLYWLAGRLLRVRDLLEGLPPRPAGGLALRDFTAYARRKLAVLVDLVTWHCDDERSATYRERMESARRTLVLAEGLDDAQAEAAVVRLKLYGRFPGKKHWDRADSRDDAKALHDELRARLEAVQAAIGQDLAAACAEAVRGYLEAYRQAKEAEGVLDFDDLLLLARDMLATSREAREHFKARFRYLLIDEFQDTDPLQVEIAFFLAERPGRHAAHWEAADLEPGKLFIVGDPKQSIYRFRRADIEIYEKAKDALGRHGARLTLSQSFRPLRRLAEAVNRIFEAVIRPPDEGRYQPDYVPLHAHRAHAPGRPDVVLLPPPPALADDLQYQDDWRRAEARCVAATIQRIVGEGWAVFDQETGEPRPVSYGDIALLARTFTASDIYADELAAAGVPLRIVGGKHFYLAGEIHSLVSVLAAIDNPHDALSVVAALRGPFFGVSDDELLVARSEHGELNYLEEGWEGTVGAAMRVLRAFHERRNAEPLALLLGRLLEETKALELFSLRPRGAQRVANLLKIVERARQLEAAERVSFRGFVRWLSHLHETQADETESPLLEDDADRVQFLTVHRSKGLEFPVVFVPDMSSGGRHSARFVVLRERRPAEGQVAFYLGRKTQSIRTANWPGEDYETVRAEAEMARLFYVATTRARDLLFLLPGWTGRSAGGFSRFLPEGVVEGEPAWGEETASGFVLDTRAFDLSDRPGRPFRVEPPTDGALPKAAQRRRAARQAWLAGTQQAVAEAGAATAWRTPSRLGEGMLGQPEEGEAPIASGEGRRVGSVVHRCLEQLGAGAAEDVGSLVDAEARRAALSPESKLRASELVRGALESRLMERARAAEACYHEVPFALEVGGTVLSGAMDLVLVEPEGVAVVDFKTDAVSGAAAAEARAATYRPQMLAYALAASRLLCAPVTEVVICFVSSGREVALPISEALLREAEACVAADE